MAPIRRPCLNCGQLTTATTRCDKCEQIRRSKLPPRHREHYRGDYQKRAKEVRDNATNCWICGGTARPNDPWTADHLLPGDPQSPLLPAHRSCNSRRGNPNKRNKNR